MTRNQMDALVASNIGCTAGYVTRVRLYPHEAKSEMAERIKAELERVNAEYQEFCTRAKKSA
jgi:hypothetical protein